MSTKLIPLLRQLNLQLEQCGRAQMQPLGLSTSEGMTLCYLLRHSEKDLCATQLHEGLGISKAALSATLKSLCRKGYLETAVFPDDDRKKRILLTPRARQLRQSMEEKMTQHSALLCRGIPPGELDAAERVLDALLHNLKEFNTGRKTT